MLQLGPKKKVKGDKSWLREKPEREKPEKPAPKKGAEKPESLEEIRKALSAATLAFGRAAAARDPKGKGKGEPKKYKKGPPDKKCPKCHGWHEECRECPNVIAAADGYPSTFPCLFHMKGREYKCQGIGHGIKHHLSALTPAAKAINDKWLGEGGAKKGGKSRGRGRGKKGGRQGSHLLLESERDGTAESLNAEERLLRALDAEVPGEEVQMSAEERLLYALHVFSPDSERTRPLSFRPPEPAGLGARTVSGCGQGGSAGDPEKTDMQCPNFPGSGNLWGQSRRPATLALSYCVQHLLQIGSLSLSMQP